MDTINPWIDPASVRQLAEKLIRPVEQSPIVTNDPGYDTSFVGFVDSDEPAEEITNIAPTPQPVAVAPTTTQPAIAAAPTPPQAAPAPKIPVANINLKPVDPASNAPKITTLIDSRFDKIRDWLTEQFGAKEIFILDQTGAVIIDESHHGRLHFIARDLILQANQQQNVRVKFGPAANLELIPCETPIGLTILGALFPYTLSNNKITLIREALNESLSA
jgi:hypothetical protein